LKTGQIEWFLAVDINSYISTAIKDQFNMQKILKSNVGR
jgi:hypothetical protein